MGEDPGSGLPFWTMASLMAGIWRYAIAGPHTPHDAMYPLHRLVRWVVDETVPAQEPSYLTPIEPEAVPA